MKDSSNKNTTASLSLLNDPPSHFTVENSLNKEMMKLSFKDRVAIEEEIHGVRCGAVEETPKLLEESLREFDDKLNARKERGELTPEVDEFAVRKLLRNVVRTKTSRLDSTQDSLQKRNCYLNDDKTRVRFLRTESFDVEKAVQRFVGFLDFASDIFGDYICDREIRVTDFKGKEEEAAIRNSRAQYLPFRDRSGRRILVAIGSLNFHLSNFLRSKILLFLHWHSSEDVETQRKGIVIVLWPHDEVESNYSWAQVLRPKLRAEHGSYHQRNNSTLPIRIAGIHLFLQDTPIYHTLAKIYMFYALVSKQKVLVRTHFGERTELLYKLSSYGIPADLLPVTVSGVLKRGNILSWLNYLRAREDILRYGTKHENIVYCPNMYDVIFRKGTTFRNNPGNSFYRGLIEQYIKEHNAAGKTKKYEITQEVVNEIKKQDGRFLEWSKENQMWVVMSDPTRIREKIAAAFKQYTRTRGASDSNKQQKQPESAISGHSNNFFNSGKTPQTMKKNRRNSDEDISLEEYYVKKRLKFESSDSEESCFGMRFHMTCE